MFSDVIAVTFKDKLPAGGFVLRSYTDKYSAYGFLGSCAGWPGNSGYADSEIGLGEFTRIFCHKESGLLGNRAVFSDD